MIKNISKQLLTLVFVITKFYIITDIFGL